MLSSKFVDRIELLSWIKKEVASYCIRNSLPILPVRYGSVPPNSKAIFANLPSRIQVWEGYSKWLSSYSPYHRDWHVHHTIFHELWHYRQYLFALKEGKRITLDIFNENDAYIQGDTKADEILSNMSTEEVNPILPVIGEGIVAGLGLGVGFKVVDHFYNKHVTKNPAKPHTEVIVTRLPKCDFCGSTVRYDGKTRMGPWANMCPAHFKMYGYGLGLGKGQKLILKNPILTPDQTLTIQQITGGKISGIKIGSEGKTGMVWLKYKGERYIISKNGRVL